MNHVDVSLLAYSSCGGGVASYVEPNKRRQAASLAGNPNHNIKSQHQKFFLRVASAPGK